MQNVKGIWGRRLPFPFNLFQQGKLATYHLKCKSCAWEKTYRVFSGTVWYAPGVTPSENVVKQKGCFLQFARNAAQKSINIDRHV